MPQPTDNLFELARYVCEWIALQWYGVAWNWLEMMK